MLLTPGGLQLQTVKYSEKNSLTNTGHEQNSLIGGFNLLSDDSLHCLVFQRVFHHQNRFYILAGARTSVSAHNLKPYEINLCCRKCGRFFIFQTRNIMAAAGSFLLENTGTRGCHGNDAACRKDGITYATFFSGQKSGCCSKNYSNYYSC